MKKTKYFIVLLACITMVNALENSPTDREKSLAQIPVLPKGAAPILKSGLNREKEILKLIPTEDKHDLFGGEPKIFAQGIMDNYGSNVELYEGNFSNQNRREYLFLSTGGGTMNTDTIVRIYKQEGKKLVKIELDPIIIRDIMHGEDLSNFYYYMPRPIGFVKGGKTYLRFMDYYPVDKPVLICTYLWENNKFTLISPKQCLH